MTYSQTAIISLQNINKLSLKCTRNILCEDKPSQAKPSQAKLSQAKLSQAKLSQAKVLTGGGDLRQAQVDVPLSVSHSCL